MGIAAIFLLLLAAPRGVLCSLGDICYILGARTAIVSDELYFIGGNYSDGQEWTETTDLYSLKLNGQFTVEQSIPQSSLTTDSISSDVTVAYDYAKNINNGDADGALWVIDDTMYVFGGNFETPTNTLSAYNTTSGEWKDVSVSGGDFNFGRRTSALTATSPDGSLGFVLGGNTPYMGASMLRFNASDPENLSWTNETLDNGSSGVDVPNLLAGAMMYIPASTEGMLIAFGGKNTSAGFSPDSGWPYEADWSTIYVYDIASHTWWMQEASGDVPSDRDMFCSAVTESPDGSAFHITTYGGWSLAGQRSYEDVYILSIPSFEWIDATKTSKKTNTEQQVNSTIGRDSMSGACQTYGSQMIVLGGATRTDSSSLIDGACSDVFEPVRVLDLSTYEWKTSLNTSSTYEVPSIIYDTIGGDSQGGATATVPASGFADSMLASLIQKRVPSSSASASASADASSSTSSTSSSSNDSTQVGDKNSSPGHSTTGAIVGGVVGGVAGLAIIICLLWYFLIRRRRDGLNNPKAAELPGGPAAAELQAERQHVEIGGRERNHPVELPTS